jgi:hypothetical protein
VDAAATEGENERKEKREKSRAEGEKATLNS